MTNVEKIRQEIERLKKWSESSKKEYIDEGYNQNAFAEDCRINSFDKLLSFIDSLPDNDFLDESKIASKELEEAADDNAIRIFPEKKSYSTVYERVVDYNAVDRKNYRDGFIAGAEWQYKNTITFLSEVMFQDMKKGICGWGEIPKKK